MGHRDLQTTQRYADYAPNPNPQETAMVEAAVGKTAQARAAAVAIPLRIG